MKLSVIIPAYNAADTIGEQLEAFSHQEWSEPWEIIVVNNRSSDNTVGVVKRYVDKIENIRIVDAVEKQGRPYALNVGVDHSRGEYVAFTDADDVVGAGWVRAIGETLKKNDIVASSFDCAKLSTDYILRVKGNNLQNNKLLKWRHHRFSPFFEYASGSSIAVRKKIHKEVGGFDEELINTQDRDYCWRIQLLGYKITFCPDALIYVRRRGTFRELYKREVNIGYWGYFTYRKFIPLGLKPVPFTSYLRIWALLLYQSPDLLKPIKRDRWLLRFASRYGELKGMVGYYLKELYNGKK